MVMEVGPHNPLPLNMSLPKGHPLGGPFALSPSHALNTCQCEDENRHSGDIQVLETSNCVKSFRDGNKVCCPSPSFTANATWPSKTTSGLSFIPSERWPWFCSLEWGARDRYTDRLSWYKAVHCSTPSGAR